MRHEDTPGVQPPRWANKLLAWRCPDYLLEEVQGDLHELFEERVAEVGLKRARRQYALDVLGFLRPFSRRSVALQPKANIHSKPNHPGMLRNYFKTAFRFLLKNKAFSFINVFGLAAGTLCCLYIVLYVSDQYGYDKHHHRAKDIYRITTTLVQKGDKTVWATASPPTAPAMKRDFGEAEQFTRVVDLNLAGLDKHLLRYEDRSFYEKDAVLADSTFFDVFTYHFTRGSDSEALTQPYTVVLLKPVADKLFGQEDPVGKVIEIESKAVKHDFTVTGVVDESLGKSHIHGNLFMTMNSDGIGGWVRKSVEWGGNIVIGSYVKLHPNANVAALERKLPAFLAKYGQQSMKEVGMTKQLHLQSAGLIHTTAGYTNEMTKTVNPSFLVVLLLIAALIQVIACINFMNLSTARASRRAKEVGVRKV
ncbi:MAG: ABC transporter permease, partial [Ferruginibacter sp.]|nr:ABC transporter permease [Cytophagales bacterium]